MNNGEPGGGQSTSMSSSLLQRLQAQDGGAWERVVHVYGPTVYGWCRYEGLSQQDAEDVGQEVWVAVARTIAGFRRAHPGDSFRGWLYTVTHNKIYDFRKRNRCRAQAAGGTTARQVLMQLPDPASSASAPAPPSPKVQNFFRRALELIRGEFADGTWRAFLLVVVDERRPADVAEELGKSLGAIYVAKSKVLQRLRAEFADLIP
jgi:RNA polymerase sigma-70 factor (ECF subfamily)